MSVQVLKISLSMQLRICTTAPLQLINLMHYIQNDFSAHLFAYEKFILLLVEKAVNESQLKLKKGVCTK